jgi:hypothetical protein
MRSILFLPASTRRRAWRVFTVAAALLAGSTAGWAQTPPDPAAQQPPAPQQQAAPGRSFSSDAGMIFNIIKPDRAADFEMVIQRLKEGLAQSEKPEHKQIATGWKVFKSVEPGPNGNILYIYFIDPAVKGADYTMTRILGEVLPSEAQSLFEKIKDAYVGQNIVNLSLIANLTPGGGMD